MSDTAETIDTTMTAYVAADARGAIVVSGVVPRWMLDAQIPPQGGTIVIGQGRARTDYIANGAITPRPANTATISGMTISNVPNPSTVTIAGGSPTTVTDGEVDLSFTQPGTYTVVVSSWPMLDATFQVTQP